MIKEFSLSESAKTSADYISELKAASKSLSVEAVQTAIEEITDRRITEILNTKSEYATSANGNVYYVSANGCDDADGKSPSTAWKSLEKVSEAEFAPHDVVLFERGGTWRGSLIIKADVTYSAYGEGAKPNLYGWDKNSADPLLWKETEIPNVYEYVDECPLSIGHVVFNHGESYARKLMLRYNADGTTEDVRTKAPYNGIGDIIEDMTFYHDLDGTKKVYLRCEAGNPGKVFDDIEMGKKRHVVYGNGNGVTIDNLCIKYGGSHGVGSVSQPTGLTVRNCEFGWIGGTLQTAVGTWGRNWATPFGNAIEIYGQAIDFTVNNNYIHDVYDAAITHQSGEGSKVHDKNIKYFDNVVENCVYAVEIFVAQHENGENTHEDIYVENNILRKGGGFGHEQRPDTGVTALIRNGRIIANTKNYVVRNNILDRSKTRIITAAADGGSKAEYYGNLYVQARGEMFCLRYGNTYMADNECEKALVALGNEHNPTIILTDKLGY